MNREIKFRCWLPSEKFMGVPFDPFDYDSQPPGHWRSESIFMQFTGLKDMNGREIYEGDIVNLKGTKCLYTVEWIQYTFKLVYIKLQRLEWGSIQRVSELNWGIEVVGNIYENQELLKS